MKLASALLALTSFAWLPGSQAAPSDVGSAELAELRQVLPASPAFDEWLRAFDYQPPDFSALPAVAFPQDLLLMNAEGKPHAVSAGDWPERRKQLTALTEDYLLGHAPSAPSNVRAVIEETKQEDGHETRVVRLEFGPDHGATLHCWLWIPPNLQRKPAPVFLVDNFTYTQFARDAFDKGQFLICVYNATDPVYRPDKKDESEAYKDLFGKYDWSEFRRRGWSASRAVDWLSTLDFVARDQIYIGGHSRSAKQALACAAFDERIAGMIASSPGSGGSLHFRNCDQYYYGESAERLTTVFPLWVSPVVRCFAGRENKLPADMHFVYALIAPRPVLMSTAINDDVESTWAVEQMYESILPVWRLLGKPANLAVRYRPGQHKPDAATHLAHSQFLLLCAEGKAPADTFPFQPYHRWSYEAWAKQNAAVPAPPGRPTTRTEARKSIEWLLGDGPAYEPALVTLGSGESDQVARGLSRTEPDHLRCRFGDVNGDFYYPPGVAPSASPRPVGSAEKLPAIIWLAPLQCSLGYRPGYRNGDNPYLHFAKAGFLVLAFDPIATGARQEERRDFYDRYPHWSLMGQMVLDARHAVDAARANPDVDPNRISLVGFGVGGMVAAFTAALDDRAAACVSASGLTAFRTDTDASGTGGIRRWSHLYGWLPRLGPFVGLESTVPIDFPEVLAAISPRPTLVIAPKLDWHHPVEQVTRVVEAAKTIAGAAGSTSRLALYTPNALVEFNNDMQNQITEFLSAQTTESGGPTNHAPAALAPQPVQAAFSRFRAAALKADTEFLASDLLEGRGPGTRGDELAMEYIAAQFAGAGLQPAGDNSTFFQKIGLVGLTLRPVQSSVSFGKEDSPSVGPLKYLEQFVASNPSQTEAAALDSEVIFVGHGVVAPEYQWDDYKGLDVHGKTLLMLVDDPPANEQEPDLFKGRTRTYYGRWTYKYEIGTAKGAQAVLLIHTDAAAGYPWAVVRNSWGRETDAIRLPAGAPALRCAGWLTESVAAELCRAAGQELQTLTRAAATRSFHPVALGYRLKGELHSTIRSFETANVIGKLPGSDPVFRDEAVLYTAHHDHLGIGEPDQTGDRIYNGAIDNATGCALLLELARVWAATTPAPKRSILFNSVAAEEQGLLGSEYYGSHPTIPAGKIALDINFDAIPQLGRVRDVTMLGVERTTFLPTAEQITRAMGLAIVPDQEPEQGHYYRSDHFSLAKVGIPAFSAAPGYDVIGKPPGWAKAQSDYFREHHYHQPSDQVDPTWDWNEGVQMAQLGFWLGWEATQAPTAPIWLPGDEFRAARDKSLGQ